MTESITTAPYNPSRQRKVVRPVVTGYYLPLPDIIETPTTVREFYQVFILVTCIMGLTYVAVYVHVHELLGPTVHVEPASLLLDVGLAIAIYMSQDCIRMFSRCVHTFLLHCLLVGIYTISGCFLVDAMYAFVTEACGKF